MRFCRNCFRSKIFCRVDENFEKCVACVFVDRICDLFIFSAIIRRIHNEKKRIREKIQKIRALLHERIIVLQQQMSIVERLKRQYEILKNQKKN